MLTRGGVDDAEINEVREAGLLDVAWYLETNPDVADAGLDAASHFCRFGWQEGRKPNPWFDIEFYLLNDDVRASGINPLLHYTRIGEAEGRHPAPYFDPDWYRATHGLTADASPLRHFLGHRIAGTHAPSAALVAVSLVAPYRDDPGRGIDPFRHYLDDAHEAGLHPVVHLRRAIVSDDAEISDVLDSGLLDVAWYLETNPDVAATGLDAAIHFCCFGWQEGRKPNPWFDPEFYLLSDDVRARGINPLLHYIRYGEAEGRHPAPYFDPGWYRAAHDLAADIAPLRHFLDHRIAGTHAPSAALFAVPHIVPYRDDPGRGVDPFRHHLEDAQARGVDPGPDPALIAGSGLLDSNHYLISSSDVHEAGLDPAAHFCRYGWAENRRPNIYFETKWYRATNPIVDRMGINPLVHYLLVGERSGRRPVVYFDPVWYRATYAVPASQNALAHFLAHRRSQAYSPTPLFDIAFYMAAHGRQVGRRRDPFMHFLQSGTYDDIDPSAAFSVAEYRRRHIGRPSRAFRGLMHPDQHNPLIHYLHRSYDTDNRDDV